MPIIFPNWDEKDENKNCCQTQQFYRLKPSHKEIKGKTIYNFCSCSLLPSPNPEPRKESWDAMKLIYSDKRVNVYQSHNCFLCKLPVIHILEEELAMFASLHVIEHIQKAKKSQKRN